MSQLSPVIAVLTPLGLAACLGTETLPPVPGSGVGVAVLGWETATPVAYLDLATTIANSESAQTLHWLEVDFDPSRTNLDSPLPLVPGGEGISVGNGAAYRLFEMGEELDWQLDDNFDHTLRDFSASPVDLEACLAFSGCVTGDACDAACEEDTEVSAPEMPSTSCPEGWSPVSGTESSFCFPDEWVVDGTIAATRPADSCVNGRFDLGSGCEDIGPCLVTRFPPRPSGIQNVIYFDETAAAGGDGTESAPYRSLSDIPGSTTSSSTALLFAAGDYGFGPPELLADYAAIHGVCSAQVTLRSNLRGAGGLSIEDIRIEGRVNAASGQVRIINSQIVGDVRALLVSPEATVTSERTLYSIARAPIAGEQTIVNRGRFQGDSVRIDFRMAVQGRDSGRAVVELSDSVVVAHPEEPLDALSNIGATLAQISLRNVEIYGDKIAPLFLTATNLSAEDLRITASDRTAISLRASSSATVSRAALYHGEGRSGDAAFETHSSSGQFHDLAMTGFRHGLALAPTTPPNAVAVRRGWFRWRGSHVIRNEAGSIGLEDVWLEATTPADDLTENQSALVLGGEAEISRVHMVTAGRNAFSINSSADIALRDIRIRGPHARTFWMTLGAAGTIERLAADASGGLRLDTAGQDTAGLIATDLDITFMPAADLGLGAELLGFPTETLEFIGGAMIWERFLLRGEFDTSAAEPSGGVLLRDGVIESLELESIPPSMLENLHNVRLRRSPAVNPP